MTPFLFVLIAIVVSDLAWWRWADRRVRPLRGAALWCSLLATFIGVQFAYLLYFVLVPHSARQSHAWLPAPFLAGFYLWSIVVMPAALLCIGIAALVRAARRRPVPTPAAAGVTRRQVLAATVVALPPLAAVALVTRAMPQLSQFRVRRLDLTVPGLPPELDGMTIAQVTDLHLGRFTRDGFPAKVADATNALRADLILFTGDLIDLSLADLPTGIDFIRKLDPRHGLAMIEGNHDLIEDADAFDTRVRAAGLPLLVDSAMTVQVRGRDVQLLGTRWGNATGDRRKGSPAALAATVAAVAPLRDPAAFPILLAHHPHAWDPAVAAGFPLTVAGHTHGGQMMLTDHIGGGPVLFRYWSGTYAKGNSHLVVSNGVGAWFPLRVNCPAEIVHLTLHPAPLV